MALGTTTALADIANLEAQGKGVRISQVGVTSGGTTAATTASGNINQIFHYNSVGSTLYSTLVDIPIQAGLTSSPLRLKSFSMGSNRAASYQLVRLYKIGTANLATGTFTHDAATFPINKTQMGSSQALDLIPFIQVTTAPATTAPAFTFTYTNQADASVTGSTTFTFPSATAAVGSCYMMRLETGDSAVHDISAMSFSATGSAGAATIWGAEIFGQSVVAGANTQGGKNALLKGISIPNILAGTATSGTASTQLVPMSIGLTLTTQHSIIVDLFEDV